MSDLSPITIGIALGGGGAAALAEIGVLEELTRAGIRVSRVAGTSAGALVGAAFAAQRLGGLRAAMDGLTRRRVFWLMNPVWPRRAFFGGRSNFDFVRPYLGERIEELPLPFAAVASDLVTGNEVILREGSVVEAIRASAAVPGVFPPCSIDGRVLVDGGLVNPLPVSVARQLGADFVIAVNVLPVGDRTHDAIVLAWQAARERLQGARRAAGFLRRTSAVADVAVAPESTEATVGSALDEIRLTAVLSRASKVVQARIAAAQLREHPPDWLINVPVSDVGLFEFHRAAEAVECGRELTRTILPGLLDALRRRPPLSAVRRMHAWLLRNGGRSRTRGTRPAGAPATFEPPAARPDATPTGPARLKPSGPP